MISGSLSPQNDASVGFRWKNGHQMRRVAVNVFKEPSRIANKGWSFRLGLSELLTNPHCKNSFCYETGAIGW